MYTTVELAKEALKLLDRLRDLEDLALRQPYTSLGEQILAGIRQATTLQQTTLYAHFAHLTEKETQEFMVWHEARLEERIAINSARVRAILAKD